MSCGCEPCEPQPYRCSCERDCWVGPPEEYAACIEACNAAGCTHPKYPGLPSHGYRCSGTVAGYDDCITPCNTDLDSDLEDCTNDLNLCLSSANNSDEENLCYSTECVCKSTAQQTFHSCRLNCDISLTYPAALTCAGDDVTADETCCATDLATCYEPCETALLTAAAPIEATYIQCVHDVYASYLGYYGWDAEMLSCNGGIDPDISPCERARLASMASVLTANRICRAQCEKTEIARETPADRKYRECGGRYHVCQETCAAQFDEDLIDAANTAYLCLEPCYFLDGQDQVDCLEPCYSDYRAAYAEAAVTQSTCNMTCCKQEYDYPRHGHALADCRLPCYQDRMRAEVSCYDAHAQCLSAAGTDETLVAACHSDWCACEVAWRSTYDTCMSLCTQRGDCPDCFDDSIEDLGSSMGYEGALSGLPQPGLGQHPTGCS